MTGDGVLKDIVKVLESTEPLDLPFKPTGSMTLAEFFGGLNHHTDIRRDLMAKVCGVTVRCINNWKREYEERKEAAGRAKPVLEAIGKVLESAVDAFQLKNPGRAASTSDIEKELRIIWRNDTTVFFHDVAVKGQEATRREKMPMPSISSIRRALLMYNYKNMTCQRDPLLTRHHLDVRLSFANMWIEIIENLLGKEDRELCQQYKQALSDCAILKQAYYSSGDARNSESWLAWKAKRRR